MSNQNSKTQYRFRDNGLHESQALPSCINQHQL